MHTDTPQDAASFNMPPHRDAYDPGTGCWAADWETYAAAGGDVQRTIVDTCDACDATTTVHVIGPNGGVLALCVDSDACRRRQQRARHPTDGAA